MRVFIVSGGQDTGGQGVRIAAALRKHGVEARAMHRADTYIRYPHDLRWDEAEARRLFDEADVVHLKIAWKLYEELDPEHRKPALAHHQGTELRDNPDEVNAIVQRIGAVQAVSTVDLLDDAPDASWLPIPHDLDWLRDKYAPRPARGRLRIAHAPTNRDAKGTETILRVIERLQQEYEFDFDLIERVEWRVCLSRKALAHVFIDQITLGYGNNAIEAMAMERAVISGWAEPADRERFVDETGQAPPFLEANDAASLEASLRSLIESAELREEVAARGRAFAAAFHSEAAVVERLLPLYERAIAARAQPARRARFDPYEEGPE